MPLLEKVMTPNYPDRDPTVPRYEYLHPPFDDECPPPPPTFVIGQTVHTYRFPLPPLRTRHYFRSGRGQSFSRAPPPLSNFVFVRQIPRHPFLRPIISSGVDRSRRRRRGSPSPESPGIRRCSPPRTRPRRRVPPPRCRSRIGSGGCKASARVSPIPTSASA